MKTNRTPSQSTKRTARLEPAANQSHNGPRAHKGDKPDRRIVALVKLLARLAAERDFRDDPYER